MPMDSHWVLWPNWCCTEFKHLCFRNLGNSFWWVVGIGNLQVPQELSSEPLFHFDQVGMCSETLYGQPNSTSTYFPHVWMWLLPNPSNSDSHVSVYLFPYSTGMPQVYQTGHSSHPCILQCLALGFVQSWLSLTESNGSQGGKRLIRGGEANPVCWSWGTLHRIREML